ncbi:autotransporter domain-containing SGNH/GDSL hydrolase family protein [Pseudomonas indica]|uniref:Outer membrane lipase/esterase n=1 Tax=Pseudomonas indica TaxID=137658 RepID=A0A1G8SZA2_9PSED|nr:autotransporter domain-containing SGNH/GDSL hydrolase family protein [Pseudomonas indica]SDJ34516.1 outer membrane lipase/esterase [Pseudomonas indica]
MKHVLTPLAAACLLAFSSSSLMASPYSGLVVFGDSLSDAGQFPDASGPAGSTRRFTNRTGPNYDSSEFFALNSTQLLSLQLGLGDLTASTSPVNAALGLPDGTNYAVGGNTTQQILDSIVGTGEGSVVELADGTNLRTRPGYLAELAALGQPIDSDTLFYVNGGGNDFLDLIINPLAPADVATAQAQASATRLADGVRALEAAGARYIVVSLLPDVGQTPNARALESLIPGISATISGLVAAFNTELVSQLAAIDAEIIPLNVPLLFNEIVADAASFGFDATQDLIATCFDSCASPNATWGIGSTTPDPSKLIFNDSVHPTSAVQQIFADYTYSLLAAPWELTLLPEMAHGTLRAHQDQLRSQWQADWEGWQAVGQWRSFVNAGGQRLDFDEQDASASGDGNGYSLNLGGSYRLDDAWRAGVALGLYQQELEAGRADSDYELRSYLATAFAQYQSNRWWADLTLSGGYLDYDDLSRKFDLGIVTRSEKGDTDGQLWAFGGRLGYDIAQPGSTWHLSPFISADYARVEVDGYAEKSDSATSLTYDDQTRTSKRLGAGFQGRFAVSPSTQVFAEVAREREYEDDPGELTMSLTSLPGIDFTLEGYTPEDRLTRASLGFSQKLGGELSLGASYHWRKGEDQTQQGVNLSVAWSW